MRTHRPYGFVPTCSLCRELPCVSPARLVCSGSQPLHAAQFSPLPARGSRFATWQELIQTLEAAPPLRRRIRLPSSGGTAAIRPAATWHYRCNNTWLCPQNLPLEDALAQVRRRQHRDEPSRARRPERQGIGSTGIAHVFAHKRAGCDPLRRQQQRRASPAVQDWFDFHGSHGSGLGRCLPMSCEEQSQAEAGDIQAGGVIARAVPLTLRVLAAQPEFPVQRLLAVGWDRGGKGPGRLVAARAGVGSPMRLNLSGADAQEATFVAEHPPELPAHGRVVAPVPPASAHATAAALGAQRGQVLAADEVAVGEQRQQNQQVGGQVGQFAVAPGVLLPARADASVVVVHPRLPAWEVCEQRGLVLCVDGERLGAQDVVVRAASFQTVDPPVQAGLAPIDAAGVEENWAAHLGVPFARALLHHRGGDERAHAPVKAQHPALRGPRRNPPGRHLQNEVEYRDAAAIRARGLPQGGGQRRGAVRESGTDYCGQRDGWDPGAPGPGAPLVWRAQLEREARPALFRSGGQVAALHHLDARPIGLPCVHPVVGGKGQLAHLLGRDGLHLLVGSRKGSCAQVVVAGLLDQIGHGYEGVRLLPHILLLGPHRPHMLADQPVIFPGRTLPLRRADQFLREQGQDGLEDLLAAGLGPQDPPRLFHLTALLPTAVAAAPRHILLHLLPGWTRTLGGKAIQLWPQLQEQLTRGQAAGIQQPQRLGLEHLGQADGESEGVRVHARPASSAAKDGLSPVPERGVWQNAGHHNDVSGRQTSLPDGRPGALPDVSNACSCYRKHTIDR